MTKDELIDRINVERGANQAAAARRTLYYLEEAGFTVVPVEPTQKMVNAGVQGHAMTGRTKAVTEQAGSPGRIRNAWAEKPAFVGSNLMMLLMNSFPLVNRLQG